MSIMRLPALDEELSSAPTLAIQVLTGEELNAVAGAVYELESTGTQNTHSICHVDGTCDGCTPHFA